MLEYPPKDLECLHKNSDTVNPRQSTDFFFIYKGFCTQKIQRQTFSIQIPLFFKYTIDPQKAGSQCQKNALINSAQNERPKFLWERFKECHVQIKVKNRFFRFGTFGFLGFFGVVRTFKIFGIRGFLAFAPSCISGRCKGTSKSGISSEQSSHSHFWKEQERC